MNISDRLVRFVCGAALAVIVGAWFGSVAGVVSWHLSAPSLPDRAWGQNFVADLFPKAHNARVDLMPEIAQYEEAEVQKEGLGFFLIGGDDYFPGQLVMAAKVDSPRDFVATVDPVLRKRGWTVASHASGEDVTAASNDLTLWVTELYPDEVEVSVYRQTPTAVFWATAVAWLAGVVPGARLGRGAWSRSRVKPVFLTGMVLSLPAAVVTSATVVSQMLAGDDVYPFIPWEAYMYAVLRPLAILGFAALCVSASPSGVPGDIRTSLMSMNGGLP